MFSVEQPDTMSLSLDTSFDQQVRCSTSKWYMNRRVEFFGMGHLERYEYPPVLRPTMYTYWICERIYLEHLPIWLSWFMLSGPQFLCHPTGGSHGHPRPRRKNAQPALEALVWMVFSVGGNMKNMKMIETMFVSNAKLEPNSFSMFEQ